MYTNRLTKTKKHSISTIKINFQDASWKYAYILKINHTKESKQSRRLCYFMIPISVQSEFRPRTWAMSALKFKVCQQASVTQNFLCVRRENLQAQLLQFWSISVSFPRVCRDLSPLPLFVQGLTVCAGVAVLSPHCEGPRKQCLWGRFWYKARPAGLEGEMWVLTTLLNMVQKYKKQEQK